MVKIHRMIKKYNFKSYSSGFESGSELKDPNPHQNDPEHYFTSRCREPRPTVSNWLHLISENGLFYYLNTTPNN